MNFSRKSVRKRPLTGQRILAYGQMSHRSFVEEIRRPLISKMRTKHFTKWSPANATVKERENQIQPALADN